MADTADVLIADANDARLAVLREILKQDFRRDCHAVRTFEELKTEFENDWKSVFVAEDLPAKYENLSRLRAGQRISISPVYQFNHLNERKSGARLICIMNDPDFPGFSGLNFSLSYLHVPLTLPDAGQRKDMDRDIERGSGLKRSPTPPKIVWDTKNYRLHEQLSSLSEAHQLTEGEDILARLTQDCFDCDQVVIRQLAQGRSGASVFWIRPEHGGTSIGEYVLKLADNRGLWKITSEIRGHKEATRVLKVRDYRRNIAELKSPRLPHGVSAELKFAVSSDRWYAICYDYLGGGNFGGPLRFLSLEKALIAAPDELYEETKGSAYAIRSSGIADVRQARLQLLETILKWLCKHLYQRPDLVKRQEYLVWNTTDRKAKEYVRLPPYQLSGRSKGGILEFLDSNEARMGSSFFPDWQQHCQRILKLVKPSPAKRKDLGKLGQKLAAILSPAHGDLNANNILLWLDESDHPFMIDFPFYQKSGHALQDLARLEVEIKFGLMDRQGHRSPPPLPALDHSESQLYLWQELEEHFISAHWKPDEDAKKTTWRAAGFKDNVALSFDLVSLVRRHAWEIQQQVPTAPSFKDEYLPALLFYTIQAIGYPSLSVFKRLLAVNSSGRLLELMGC